MIRQILFSLAIASTACAADGVEAAIEGALYPGLNTKIADNGVSISFTGCTGALAPCRYFGTRASGATKRYNWYSWAPTEGDGYPVLIYAVGTFGSYLQAPYLQSLVEEAASRGFVALSVEYDNDAQLGCDKLKIKASGIYGEANPRGPSAVDVACALPNADCSKGVVVAGHSQGSMMALLAHDYDPRVRAALGLGSGVRVAALGLDLSGCLASPEQVPGSTRALADDAIRIVDGENDGVFGALPPLSDQLRQITNASCVGGDCLREDGSGHYLVTGGELGNPAFVSSDDTTGARHCYMQVRNQCGSDPARVLEDGTQVNVTDLDWLHGAAPFTADSNLAWLKSKTDP
jgi:hypothetical protein